MAIVGEILNWMNRAEIWLLFLFFGSLLVPVKLLGERMQKKRDLMKKPLGLSKGQGT